MEAVAQGSYNNGLIQYCSLQPATGCTSYSHLIDRLAPVNSSARALASCRTRTHNPSPTCDTFERRVLHSSTEHRFGNRSDLSMCVLSRRFKPASPRRCRLLKCRAGPTLATPRTDHTGRPQRTLSPDNLKRACAHFSPGTLRRKLSRSPSSSLAMGAAEKTVGREPTILPKAVTARCQSGLRLGYRRVLANTIPAREHFLDECWRRF